MRSSDFLGPRQNLPGSIVRKLVHFISGRADVAAISRDERLAVFDAMQRTQRLGQSMNQWCKSATGLLRDEGWVRADRDRVEKVAKALRKDLGLPH